MQLSDGVRHHLYVIEGIETSEEIKLRLRGMGLTPGTRLQLIRRKRCGTMIVWARGTRLALSGGVANKIHVREISENAERKAGDR